MANLYTDEYLKGLSALVSNFTDVAYWQLAAIFNRRSLGQSELQVPNNSLVELYNNISTSFVKIPNTDVSKEASNSTQLSCEFIKDKLALKMGLVNGHSALSRSKEVRVAHDKPPASKILQQSCAIIKDKFSLKIKSGAA